MTNASQEYLKKKGITPTISFRDGKIHVLKYVKSELRTIQTEQGPKEGVAYLFTEDEKPVRYFTGATSFIQPMAEVEENETVKIQLVKKNISGQVRSFFQIEKVQVEFPIDKSRVAKEFPKESEGEVQLPEEEIYD